jgi:hypothetical protein
VPECRKLLRQLGPQTKEFKGGQLKPGNQATYRSFLNLFRNLSAVVASQSPLRSVITLDGTSLWTGAIYDSVKYHICLALNRVGISDCELLAAEFSRHLVWLKDHFTAISNREFPNPIVLTFDNQYRYASEMKRLRAVVRNGNEITSFKPLEEILTIAANCLLDQWTTPTKLPPLQQLSFRDSSEEFGLQAADLFSNLFFNYILAQLGHSDNKSTFKANVLQALLPSLNVAPDHLSDASLVALPDGQMSFQLNTQYFGLQTILGPTMEA